MSSTTTDGWDRPLMLAGVLTFGMGAYHFFLPAQFGWAADLRHDPMLEWALLSINTFFSTLLTLGGALTCAIAARPWARDGVARLGVAGMAVFWLVNAAFQVLDPMPLPARLAALHGVLLGFALVVLGLYGLALWRSRRPA